MSADLLARLIAAGTPAELVGEVAMLAARAEAASEAIEGRRAKDRARQQLRRHAMSRDVTLGHDTSRETADAEPAPSPPSPNTPHTPQEPQPPHPHPGYYIPLARWLAASAVWGMILAEAQGRKPRPAAPKRRWPADMPPPDGVSDDQWAGLIAHRIAKRQPLTPRAYELLVGKLALHADDDWPPGRIVDLIVERGWLTFEPAWITRSTEQRNGQRSYHDRPSGAIEARRRAREQYGVDDGDGAGVF